MMNRSSLRRNAGLFSLFVASPSLVHALCENLPNGRTCAPGCWNEGGLLTTDGHRICVPVGQGYYGPIHSNQRFPCEPGTASDIVEAVACTPCEPGSMAPLQRLAQCILCPPGYFQDNFGGSTCLSCIPGYDGEGSVGMTTTGLCIGGEEPSASPSNHPTSQPSIRPSASPSVSPSSIPSMLPTSTTPSQSPSASPSQEPSTNPSATPSLTVSRAPSSEPSAAPSYLPSLTPSSEPSNIPSELPPPITKVDAALNLEEGACGNDEFVLHGQCSQCPSLLRSAVLAALLAVCVLVLATYFILTAPFGTAVLFVGVEFFQLLSLVGITHVQWPKLVDYVFAFAAIIGLDIDIIAPIQCHLGVSPQVNHLIVMLLPFLLAVISIGCVSLWHVIRKKRTEQDLSANFNTIARLSMLGLVFGYMKIVVTSLEAISCSSTQGENDQDVIVDPQIDWFCLGKGSVGGSIVAFLGLISFFVYGIGLPVVLYIVLHHYRDEVWTGMERSSVVLEVARVFLLTYCDDRWWWTVFVLVRKLVFVLVVTLFPDIPILSLVFIIIVVMVSAAMQWKESPYFEDTADSAEGSETARSFSLLRHQTVDLILHGSLIAIALFGILFLFISTSSNGRVGLGLFVLLVLIGSMLLLVAAAFRACKNRLAAEVASGKATGETVTDLENGIIDEEVLM